MPAWNVARWRNGLARLRRERCHSSGSERDWTNEHELNSTSYSLRSSDSAPSRQWHFLGPLLDEGARMPVPPFTRETALQKVKAADAAWNSRDPATVARAYSVDSVWRNRTEIFRGRTEIEAFLTRKWCKETEYVLEKNLWAFSENRIGVRFEYEWKDVAANQWYRTHGNELWEFDERGYMRWRDMSANDFPIHESERRLARA
ncbi:hypothetical protein FVE85_8690 [Porphyridium purpureum]|uniref:Uncharacterized protein n=1 Tax=Porphyridium purpureum TaxID=35688 RepID=A0A5J4YPW8_PORPP|nr:hypothetical protein FVE85_8690 [Porphyridium purpureum]|eukprot:POR0690..scf296_7